MATGKFVETGSETGVEAEWAPRSKSFRAGFPEESVTSAMFWVCVLALFAREACERAVSGRGECEGVNAESVFSFPASGREVGLAPVSIP